MNEVEIEQEKNRIRERILNQRRNIPDAERIELSARISRHLFDWSCYRKARAVHCFIGVETNGEVDTAPILERMLEDGKRIYLPRLLPEPGELEHIRYRKVEELQPNRLGIPEPTGEERGEPTSFDLILVPMLASDPARNRLGYGLGYYDRFLCRCSGMKAGLIYRRFVHSEPLPVEPHDVPLDALITEDGIDTALTAEADVQGS